MTKGELPLAGIKDFVELEQGPAWLSFELGDDTSIKTGKWDATVNDDWIDQEILVKLEDPVTDRHISDTE